jgi:hypothetical protein
VPIVPPVVAAVSIRSEQRAASVPRVQPRRAPPMGVGLEGRESFVLPSLNRAAAPPRQRCNQ